MLKKIDKLLLTNFLGPFFITFGVVIFILLTQHMVGFTNDLIGKGLDLITLGQLIYYFSLTLVSLALPLSILISSLISFGNLGEHNELTALKSGGISLPRVMLSSMLFTIMLVFVSFWFNNTVIPYANLKAYSLLYDVKQKKPSLEIKAGTFYDGIPNYSIKVRYKYPDGKALRDVVIYDHSKGLGNTDVTVADSAQMYAIKNNRYLVLELFNGKSYSDGFAENAAAAQFNNGQQFAREYFKHTKLVFSLESFELKRLDESLFANNRIMRNVNQLTKDIDSLGKTREMMNKDNEKYLSPYYRFHFQHTTMIDSIKKINQSLLRKWQKDSLIIAKYQKLTLQKNTIDNALNRARNVRTMTQTRTQIQENLKKDVNSFRIEFHRKYSNAVACFVMFLIGAPLGAIIKKGGLGIPILVSIIFFIIFYILTMTGEKWAKESYVPVIYGMWSPIVIMFAFGIFFMQQARTDSRIFEADIYYIWVAKIRERIKKIRKK